MKILKLMGVSVLFLSILLTGCPSGNEDGNPGLPKITHDFLGTTVVQDISAVRLTSFTIVTNREDFSMGVAAADDESIYLIQLEDKAPEAQFDFGTAAYGGFKAALKTANGGTDPASYQLATDPLSMKVYVLADGKLFIVNKDAQNAFSIAQFDVTKATVAHLTLNLDVSILDTNIGAVFAPEENVIYIVASISSDGLAGVIAWAEGPFDNGATIKSYRSTKFTSSISGRGYGKTTGGIAPRITDAPIQAISYAYINGQGFLSGQNTCSPGFTIKTADLKKSTSVYTVASKSVTNPISFTQTFNMSGNTPSKVFHHRSGGKTYYFVLDENGFGSILERVGQKYIDGSLTAANTGANADILDPTPFGPTAAQPNGAIAEEDLKQYPNTITKAAPYGDGKLLVFDTGDGLKVIDV